LITHLEYGIKKQFEFHKARDSFPKSVNTQGSWNVWPYIIMERCRGKIFADLRDSLSSDDTLKLATFLGEQLHYLHQLPRPPFNGSNSLVSEQRTYLSLNQGIVDAVSVKTSFPPELSIYIRILNKKKEDIASRLAKWGNEIPGTLLERVSEYLPDDFEKFFDTFEDEASMANPYTWVHSDVMDDNVLMKPCNWSSCCRHNGSDLSQLNNGGAHGPCHIIDFSDLTVGHPISDLIPVHLDIFRGDSDLLKQFLRGYKLPIVGRRSAERNRLGKASYLTM